MLKSTKLLSQNVYNVLTKAMAPPVRIKNSYRKIQYYFKIHTGGDNMH